VDAFAHESGIHADGLLKDRRTYEAFEPEEVGQVHQIVIGKHSGTSSVQSRFARLGISLAEAEARSLMVPIRKLAIQKKRPLTDAELMEIRNTSLVGQGTCLASRRVGSGHE
jgi:homocitrate synthase NifV